MQPDTLGRCVSGTHGTFVPASLSEPILSRSGLGAIAQPGGADDELCAMFDESSQCTIFLPVECLGYGPVVPFPAYGFAALVSNSEDLNSLNY